MLRKSMIKRSRRDLNEKINKKKKKENIKKDKRGITKLALRCVIY
jgi:ribosome recycling factor